jgi:hypothetical protein
VRLDEEETLSTPMPLESPGPPLSFRYKTLKRIENFVVIFGPGGVKPDACNLMLSLTTYLTPFLIRP